MLRKLLLTAALLSSIYGADTQYFDPEFSVSELGLFLRTEDTTVPGDFSVKITITSDTMQADDWKIRRITSNPIPLLEIQSDPSRFIDLKRQWINEITHLLVDLRPAVAHLETTPQTVQALRTMFWNRVHLIKAWYESIVSMLDSPSPSEDLDKAIYNAQATLQRIQSFCETQDQSDLKPFVLRYPPYEFILNMYSNPGLHLQLLQSFFNIFDPGDELVVFPEHVPAVEVKDSTTDLKPDPEHTLFREPLTQKSVEEYLDFDRLIPRTDPMFNKSLLGSMLILTNECHKLISWLSVDDSDGPSVDLVQQLFWNRIYLIKMLMEKAILNPNGFIDTTLNALRFSYPRLVFFIDKITLESAEYFQITPTSETHRVYEGGLYQGRNHFTPGERLAVLFNGLWN
ncbi:hypothetical protein [Candidatus Bodocaedibacter vickermanii]|uniref:Uncharacterized protein n=1 Tax=Candidatus Bodocaedibacter vickermanii TaxID=2741701 RepID=A0A7L9RTJ2_9PROT|nr:hypothetical protein CPBP_00453 [Candidatus Paracaedibacteraceae bacterium 'Lake Konstanz']